MIAGARDFLATPVGGQKLHDAVSAALKRTAGTGAGEDSTSEGRAAARTGEVLTVFGPKGGCGKTTIATNLAVELALTTRARVALADVSARFGDVALTLDAPVEFTLADAVRNLDSLTFATISNYLTPHPSGLFLLPASRDSSDWDAIKPDAVRRIVGLLAQTYDYTVLDAPQAFTYTVAAAVDLATVAYGVTTLDITSVKDMTAVAAIMRGHGFPMEKLRLVVNHRGAVKGATPEEIAQAVGVPVACIIPHDKALQAGIQTGIPAVEATPNSPASQAIGAMVRALIGADEPTPAKPRGLFARLTGFRQPRISFPQRKIA
jgi:pilus assembly protein CpaE